MKRKRLPTCKSCDEQRPPDRRKGVCVSCAQLPSATLHQAIGERDYILGKRDVPPGAEHWRVA